MALLEHISEDVGGFDRMFGDKYFSGIGYISSSYTCKEKHTGFSKINK